MHLKILLQLDIILQVFLLSLTIWFLLSGLLKHNDLTTNFFGMLRCLGGYQVATASVFAISIPDRIRWKYLLICLIYFGLAAANIFSGMSASYVGIVIFPFVPLFMAFYYLWYSFKFNQKYKIGLQ